MRKAKVLVSGVPAGTLEELEQGSGYVFRYETAYAGPRVSLTLPVDQREVHFDRFPPFFEGLLPEGEMLEGLLRQRKIDRHDFFSQLIAIGQDTVGAVTIFEER